MAQKRWASKKMTMSPINYFNDRKLRDNSQFPRRFMNHRFATSEGLFRKNLMGHFGCINAIEFSNNGGNFLASGGDDRRIMLWNIQDVISSSGSSINPNSVPERGGIKANSKTISLRGEHHSNIFSLAFDSQNKNIFSGGNDAQVLVHDIRTGETIDVFLHEDAVFGVVIDPHNDNVFASAGDDGRVLIWDIRVPSHHEPFILSNYTTSFHAVVYHPMEPRFLATANSKEGVALWDIRKPRHCLLRYGGMAQQSAMSVRFDYLGRRLLALRRRLPPVLYDLHNPVPTFQFDHSGYYNSCTMKTGCFAGDKHQYVVSGSDDFNLYVWEVPERPLEEGWVGEAHMVLKGHRSIVNQVCFNNDTHMIASSGVEKVIKLWSPFALPQSQGSMRGDQDLWEVDRPMYSRGEYLNLMMNSSSALSYDYSNQSMEEDPRMIAFFDSLVQREIEGGVSESSDSDISTDQILLSVSDFQLIESRIHSDSESLSSVSVISNSDQTTGESERHDQANIESRKLFNLEHRAKRAIDSYSSSSDATDEDKHDSTFVRHVKQNTHVEKHKRHKKTKLPSDQQIENNRLVSLRQRLACKKVLRHKMLKKPTQNQSVKIILGSYTPSNDTDDSTVTKANTLPIQKPPTIHQTSVGSLRRRIVRVANHDTVTSTDSNPQAPGSSKQCTSANQGTSKSESSTDVGLRQSGSEDQPSCSWNALHDERLDELLAMKHKADKKEFKPKDKKTKRQYRSKKNDSDSN